MAVQPAQPREFGLLQPRNGTEQFDLRAMFELGLKADHVPQRAQLVVLPQLHHRVRPASLRVFGCAIARIVEPDRLLRPTPQSSNTSRPPHLYRHATTTIRQHGNPSCRASM